MIPVGETMGGGSDEAMNPKSNDHRLPLNGFRPHMSERGLSARSFLPSCPLLIVVPSPFLLVSIRAADTVRRHCIRR